ncbi:hypothetical protein KJS94_04840 [Flavihumibacter rivuli]|uniref:hypothetical protein n=1 Tax=Flavihumibacter rivuli TaxID=2838156 RepID=UPI001BDE5D96|nr:hypothetical protein [Flavihumibacter rivuli]ULQ57525.1 hypothetical protein KJS94_04840 [Flavihumibacter rivuli]
MQKTLQAVVLGSFLLGACSSSRTVSRPAPRPSQPTVIIVDDRPNKLPPGQAKKVYGGSAKDHAPGHRKKQVVYYPLIIIRTPDIVIRPFGDGRYYYKNAAGYYYWQGSDGRLYLDEQYVRYARYNDNEYNEWKGRGGKKEKDDDDDRKENGNAKGKGNGNGNGKGQSNGKGKGKGKD